MVTESRKANGLTPLERARAKLKPRAPTDSTLPAVAAAALFAFCALTFAAAAILAPPNVVAPMAKPGVQ
jgi:hypothetical protein